MNQKRMPMHLSGHGRKADFRSFEFRGAFLSAALFVCVFSIGYAIYPPLSEVLRGKFSFLADPYLKTILLPYADFSLYLAQLLLAVRYEWGLLLLLFLFSFTYFTKFLTSLSVSLYALSLGMAMGRLSFFLGSCLSPFAFYSFLIAKAFLSALFLFYMQDSFRLSHSFRFLSHKEIRYAWRETGNHLFRGLLLALLVFFISFLQIFLIR